MRNPSIQLWQFSRLPKCNKESYKYHLPVRVWQNGSSQVGHPGGSFYAPEVQYTTWAQGTPWLRTKTPVCPAARQFPLYLYFLLVT